MTPDDVGPGPRWGAGTKTGSLAVALTLGSLAIVVAGRLLDHPAIRPTPVFTWWGIALVSIFSELVPVHVDIRRETYTFTLNEVPMVIGLFFARPSELIIGRLLGELLVLVVRERQSVRKVVLNLSVCLAGTVALIGVYRLLGAPADVDQPPTWGLVVLSVAVAGIVGYLAVGAVIRWHGGPADLATIMATGLLTVPVNTALGLTAAVLLVASPWSTLLLSSVVLFLFASYRAYAQLGTRYASLSLLHDFTRFVSASRSPDVVLEAILTHAKELLVTERAEIWLADDGDFVGLEVGGHGLVPTHVPPGAETLLHSWFAGATEAITAAPALQRGRPEIARALRARECIVAPITEGTHVIGLIAAIDRIGEVAFRPRDTKLFTTLAAHASAALENGRLIDRLHDEARVREHQALHDPLTDLPNRVLFGRRLRDELDAADRGRGIGPVVGLLDLDGFKQINDTLGHHWGDHALVEVARRLARATGPSITVARLGGDEFALLIPSIHDEELDPFAGRLHRAITEPLVLSGREVSIGVSIGLAKYAGEGVDGAVLMRRADAAMYRAKQETKSGQGQGYALASFGEGMADH